MGKRAFLLSFGVISLVAFGGPALSQETSPTKHLVIQFQDPGPPAIHKVEGKVGADPDLPWLYVPAGVSRPDPSLPFEARLEVPDAECAVYRVKRLAGTEVPPMCVLSVGIAQAAGVICPIDSAYPASVCNKELQNELRFRGLVPGKNYVPGEVIVGFNPSVPKEEAVALFSALGLPFEPHFPCIFHLDCGVISGDIAEHIERLEDSGIVLHTYIRSEDTISVSFNCFATISSAAELLSSIEGLEPDWSTYLEAEKFGVVYVPEAHEFAWIVALEHVPGVTYAEPNYWYDVADQ